MGKVRVLVNVKGAQLDPQNVFVPSAVAVSRGKYLMIKTVQYAEQVIIIRYIRLEFATMLEK